MSRSPFGSGKARRRAVSSPPETAPQLLFRGGDSTEPPALTAFNDKLRDDPRKVLRVIEARRQATTKTIPDEDMTLTVAVVNLTISSHWEGSPPGLGLDQTTQKKYIEANRARLTEVGKMQAGTPEHVAAQYDLRLRMLAALAMRSIEAASIDAQRAQGIIFMAPGAELPRQQAA